MRWGGGLYAVHDAGDVVARVGVVVWVDVWDFPGAGVRFVFELS
jgi:hypothetical protein